LTCKALIHRAVAAGARERPEALKATGADLRRMRIHRRSNPSLEAIVPLGQKLAAGCGRKGGRQA